MLCVANIYFLKFLWSEIKMYVNQETKQPTQPRTTLQLQLTASGPATSCIQNIIAPQLLSHPTLSACSCSPWWATTYSTVAATCRLLHTRASSWGPLYQTSVPSSARSRTRAAAQENNCSFSVFFSFVVISATSGVIDQCTVQDEADKSRPYSWPLQYGQPPAVVPACLVLHTINRGVPAITSQSKREIDLWVCLNRKIN